MSTSTILLDQNFNANYVDIMVFEHSGIFTPGLVYENSYQKKTSKIDYLPSRLRNMKRKQ